MTAGTTVPDRLVGGGNQTIGRVGYNPRAVGCMTGETCSSRCAYAPITQFGAVRSPVSGADGFPVPGSGVSS